MDFAKDSEFGIVGDKFGALAGMKGWVVRDRLCFGRFAGFDNSSSTAPFNTKKPQPARTFREIFVNSSGAVSAPFGI